MKKCYIAGKITGLSLDAFTQNFESAKNEVKNLGFEPVSPTDLKHDHDRTWLSYMREDLKAMLECDVVYVQRNWNDSPGASIEVLMAKRLGLQVIYQAHEIDC
jgi:hypothetical protein